MKRIKKPSVWLTGTGVVCALTIAVFFQNCGKAGFDADGSDISLSVGKVSQEKVSAPMAFSATFDQISYMSCFGSSAAGKAGFYSIRAGGYGAKGGLRMNKAFMDYANQAVSPIYPAVLPSTEQVKQFLSETPVNVGSAPQMAIRERADLRSVRTAGSAAALNVDFVNLTLDPTDDRVMDPVIRAPANASFVNYFPLGTYNMTSNLRDFEASLTYNSGNNSSSAELLTEAVTNDLGMYSSLTLTFPENVGTSVPKTPDASNTGRAYGRGFYLGFTMAPGAYLYAPENILSSVSEYDLETGNTATDPNAAGTPVAASWTCDPSMRVKIYRPADRDACPPESFASLADPAKKAKLETIRRHLKAEYWDVNVSSMCAVPREGDCYPPDTNPANGLPYPVEYTTGAACFSAAKMADYPPGATLPVNWCAQYVSFCIKQ